MGNCLFFGNQPIINLLWGNDLLDRILGIGQVDDIRDYIALCLLGTSVVMSSGLGGNRSNIIMRPRASPIHRSVTYASVDGATDKSNTCGVPHEHALQDLYLAVLVLRTCPATNTINYMRPMSLFYIYKTKRTPKGRTSVPAYSLHYSLLTISSDGDHFTYRSVLSDKEIRGIRGDRLRQMQMSPGAVARRTISHGISAPSHTQLHP